MPLSTHDTKTFFKQWGTIEKYYEHCISELTDDDVQFLMELADKDGNIYFVVYLDETRVIIPSNIKELIHE
jgi:hypothetical protein